MSDQDQEGADTAEREGAEGDGDEYEIERIMTRKEGTVVLRQLADGVANGSIEFGDQEVTATVPERFELEIEYEQERGKAELEVELEWPVVDGEAVAAERESEAYERSDAEEMEAGEDGAETNDADAAEEGELDAEADAGKSATEVVGMGSTASNARFELYRDRADEWRWRLVHDNGNIIADSGEGYDRKATARNGLESVMRNAPGAAVVDDAD